MKQAKHLLSTSDASDGARTRRSRSSMESKRVRLQPIFELLLPTMAMCYLLWLGGAVFTDTFYYRLRNDRATIQIIIQVISHVLGSLQVSSLRTTFNISTRRYFFFHAVSLKDLSLWAALSTGQVNVNLPSLYLFLTVASVAASLLPGALWAGALSPLFVLKTEKLGLQILPAFTDRTQAIWDSQFQARGPQIWNINDACTVINDRKGLVPSCPVPTLQGLLLLSASSATTLNEEPRNHSKLDSPSWEYVGRSFGVGSSVGLAKGRMNDDRVLYYSYIEFGYVANVLCIKNSTSDFTFRLIDYADRTISATEYQNTHHPELEVNHSLPQIYSELSTYFAEGYLPSSLMGVPERYPVISWHKESANISAWAATVNNNRNMIAVAAGTDQYQELNQTQCEVYFTPTAFNVTVDRVQQTISVSAQPTSIPAPDVDPTGHLAANAMHSLNLLSRMSPSLYVSVLGETLSRNVERMRKQAPHLDPADIVTSAVADSFTAIIDDILVAYGASQVANANDTTSSRAHGVVEAVQIGQPLYRSLVFLLYGVMILPILVEAFRTGCWHRLPKFNYLDITSNIIAASAGGGEIARAVVSEHREQETEWVADGGDPVAHAVRVQRGSHGTLDETGKIAIVKARNPGSMREKRMRE